MAWTRQTIVLSLLNCQVCQHKLWPSLQGQGWIQGDFHPLIQKAWIYTRGTKLIKGLK